ncbi:MAG: DUF4861 family protein [Bacteroidota bacterium]|jgi:pectinesterase
MKPIIVILISCVFTVTSSAQEVVVRVVNPAPFDRQLETVEVPWSELQGKFAAGDQNSVAVFDNGKQLVSQTIDIDGDGTPDVLLFQSFFRKGEDKSFVLKKVDGKVEFPAVTDAKLSLPRRDVAWENDRIAHRIYGSPLAGDVLNGIDVWVKRVRHRIIDTWYAGDSLKGNKRISYHVDHGEGADFFNVGRSLGAGGCAPWKDGVIHQPGLFVKEQITATGPIRAMFTVWYEKDTVGGLSFKEEKTYTLDAGSNLDRIDVRYYDVRPDDRLQFAAGLVKRSKTTRYANEKECWLSLWGYINDDTVNGSLGIGVVLPKASFIEMNEDKVHYLIIGSTSPGNRFTYYAGAGWTRSGDFSSADDWNGYLARFAHRIAYPLRITVTKTSK